MRIYIIGSLRNDKVIDLANRLRAAGHDPFVDWHSAGPEADDFWKQDQQKLGKTFVEALAGPAAQHVFDFDRENILRSDAVVLALPAGKSGHLEFGFAVRGSQKGYILMDKPDNGDRWDVMYNFADAVCTSVEDLIARL